MRVFICTCSSQEEIETFAKNGYIVTYETENACDASSSSDCDSESEDESLQPAQRAGDHSPHGLQPETSSSLSQSSSLSRTMPGSFDEREEEESGRGVEGEEIGGDVKEGRYRGREKKVVIPLGLEILGMTVVTERGRRWKMRELEEGLGIASRRGRFERRGWRWSW